MAKAKKIARPAMTVMAVVAIADNGEAHVTGWRARGKKKTTDSDIESMRDDATDGVRYSGSGADLDTADSFIVEIAIPEKIAAPTIKAKATKIKEAK